MVHSTAVQGSGRRAKGQETKAERMKSGEEKKKFVKKTRIAFKAGTISSCNTIIFCFGKASPLF